MSDFKVAISRETATKWWNQGYYSDRLKSLSLFFFGSFTEHWFAELSSRSEWFLSLQVGGKATDKGQLVPTVGDTEKKRRATGAHWQPRHWLIADCRPVVSGPESKACTQVFWIWTPQTKPLNSLQNQKRCENVCNVKFCTTLVFTTGAFTAVIMWKNRKPKKAD